ncbi:MAG: glycosyltransferase family 2 protein, partial [Pseudomonadota bacterium]
MPSDTSPKATTLQTTAQIDLTVIVPFLDERETLVPLCDRIDAAVAPLGLRYEVIYVDDGSTDGGEDVAADLARDAAHVKLIRFTRNFGKAAALSAGIARARGQVIVTMDADLQDDPAEIPRFLEALGEGYDVVSGWKHVRHDPIGKTFPSKVFNWCATRLFEIKIHDINCGFKAYTRRAALHLNLYGELHRFTPALLAAAGFKVSEIKVQHHAR